MLDGIPDPLPLQASVDCLVDEGEMILMELELIEPPLFLGLVLPEALSARASDRLRRALKRTIESEPASVVVQQRAQRW